MRESRMGRWAPTVGSLAAGAASVFAYAPFGFSPLIFVSLAVLYGFCSLNIAARKAAFFGFAWGIGAFAAGVGWLIIAMHRYGGMPLALSVLALLLFAAYLALYPALACYLFARLRTRSTWGEVFLFAACWTLGEYLRGTVFTGFPWLAVGYTQTPPSPLAGYAPLVGVYGVGFCVALCAALLSVRPISNGTRMAGLGAIAGACALGFALQQHAWTRPAGPALRVALLQTNIAQDMKWRAERIMDWLRLNEALVEAQHASLIVLPETSLPVLEEQLPAGYLETLAARVRAAGGDVIVGVFTRDAQDRIYNSAISRGISPSQRYSKNHLVPFGEFSPPLFGWFYALANIPMSDQSRGGAMQSPLRLGGQRVAVNICYEDAFGEELLHALPEASLMLNLSNLAWYGDSHAQAQHLQIAQMRALETGRPMLRATNTGMTAVVQPDGRVSHVLPAFQRGALVADVRGYQGMTPYAQGGNVPVLLGLGLILLAHGGCRFLRQIRRNKQSLG